jgi:hypothetical protein
MAAVRQIYDHFGWSLSKETQERMDALVAGHAQRQPGNHRYHLSQFGSSAEEVLKAFGPYCQRFGSSQLNGENLWPSRPESSLPETQKRFGLASFARNNGENGG